MSKCLIIVEGGIATAYHDSDVEVVVIDFDPLKVGEGIEELKESLPENWNTEWAGEYPVAVADINERISFYDEVDTNGN